MDGFTLKIFFSGLIALLPSSDGKELTVLLVNSGHEYRLADDSELAHHRPLLLARAARCEQTCTTPDQAAIAQYIYAKKTPDQAATALNGALAGGGAWQLSGSDLTLPDLPDNLSIQKDVRGHLQDGSLQRVPTTAAEREDFSWVASLGAIAPGIGGFTSWATATEPPPSCKVAARLKLRSGRVFTYSLIKVDGKAKPIHFRKPSGEGPDATYSQALANWVAAEIHVPGDFVEIVDQNFDDRERVRTMKLYPQEGKVEVAILNLPDFEAPAPDAEAPAPAPGQHFQIYYDLVKTPPARAARPVPHLALAPPASEPQTDWGTLHPRAALWSDLLEQLNLSPRGKGPYDLSLCPVAEP
ncbi:MAG: hypothetical protein DMF56_19310 [Acidobacteria bacterium]|nr:MAG: hypothetical protein DMF56_19310 [Acidobacteriota bacterium]